MKKSKYFWIIIVIIIIIVIAFIFFIYNFMQSELHKNKTEDMFTKKTECQKLQSELETRLSNKYSGKLYKDVSLDKIFYSPIKNSCLYTYRVWSANEIGKPSFYLVDAYTNDMLYSFFYPENEDGFIKLINRFDSVVEQYEINEENKASLPKPGTTANFEIF